MHLAGGYIDWGTLNSMQSERLILQVFAEFLRASWSFSYLFREGIAQLDLLSSNDFSDQAIPADPGMISEPGTM